MNGKDDKKKIRRELCRTCGRFKDAGKPCTQCDKTIKEIIEQDVDDN